MLRKLVERLADPLGEERFLKANIEPLMKHTPLIQKIESFWLSPEHRKVESWTAHGDINGVMLATSLVPGGYLDL
jgi:hypothetical protein